MTKDVLVSVSGLHNVAGEEGEISVVTSGYYYWKNGKHYIIYDEFQEGEPEPVHCTIKIADDYMEMIRGGIANSRMVFKPGKTTVSSYHTPIGELYMQIRTEEINVHLEEDSLEAKVRYGLELNMAGLSKASVVVKARSRGTVLL